MSILFFPPHTSRSFTAPIKKSKLFILNNKQEAYEYASTKDHQLNHQSGSTKP